MFSLVCFWWGGDPTDCLCCLAIVRLWYPTWWWWWLGLVAYRAGLLVGGVAGQRDEVLERVLRAQVGRVADGRVGQVGGGGLGQERRGGEVQRRGGVRTPADAWREEGVGEQTVCFISDNTASHGWIGCTVKVALHAYTHTLTHTHIHCMFYFVILCM